MRADRIRVLEGPNVWSKNRVLEAEMSQFQTCPATHGLRVQRLSRWWAKADATIAPSDYEAFAWPLSPSDDADLIRVLMLNLQRRVNLPVCEGYVRYQDRPQDKTYIAVEIVEEAVGRSAWELACDLWNATKRDDEFDLASRLQQFKELAFEICLGQTTGAIVLAALARGIPVLRLDEVSLVQLGHGARQRRLQTAVSDRSGYIAESISRDKSLTKSLLARVGLPVPVGRLVRDADDAWAAACELGLPVVVKPRDADYGQGVSLKLTTRTEIAAAYREALEYSESVIVERFLEGAHHRLMVIGGEVVAAVRFERVVAVGDGQQTVAQLIEEMNRDPRRGARTDRTRPWFWIELDDETCRVLASQGISLEDKPRPGERITLRFEPRIGWGGGVFDVTDEVHPDVAATVIDAVSMVGLDIAGVDVIANEISRPLTEQNGGILEVNAGPAILMHLRPFSDPPRPVPESIVSFMFSRPEQSRLPIVGILGNTDQSTVTSRIAELLQSNHAVVGQATRSGVFVNKRCLRRGRSDDVQGSRILLLHPKVEAAVMEVSLENICEEGLAFDQCHVTIVLEMETAPDTGGSTSGDRAAALQVLLDSAHPHGTAILNVDDPDIANAAARCSTEMIAISARESNPMIERIRQAGGRSVFLRNKTVILGNGSHEFPLFPLGHVDSDRVNSQCGVLEMLASIAAGWALGVPHERLRREVIAKSSVDSMAEDLPIAVLC